MGKSKITFEPLFHQKTILGNQSSNLFTVILNHGQNLYTTINSDVNFIISNKLINK
jgi:hypothetical protein